MANYKGLFNNNNKQRVYLDNNKMLSIKLNITCLNKAIICFRSGISLSFIGIIQIDISVGITNFHVVDTLILFVLYLKKFYLVFTSIILSISLFVKTVKAFLLFSNKNIPDFVSINIIKWMLGQILIDRKMIKS